MIRPILLLLVLLMISACNLEQAATPTADLDVVEVEPSATITPTPPGAVPNPIGVGTPFMTATPSPEPTERVAPDLSLPLPTTPTTETVEATADTGIARPPLDDFIKQDNISLSPGQTLAITYTVELDNPGNGQVFFVLLNPVGEVVWEYAATETETDTAEINITANGIHELLVALQNASGGFGIDGNYTVAYELR